MVEQVSGNAGLVLAGAVVLGAFEAGAVGALAEKHPEIASRIVRVAGTSAGALNAAVIAVGVATGRLQKAAEVLQGLWVKDGSFSTIARLPVRGWAQVWADRAHLRGLFETAELQSLVKEAIGEVLTGWDGARHPVTLTLVTTNLNGTGAPRGRVPLPVFEQPMVFETEALVDPARRDSVALAAAASASFPVVFAPTHVERTPCIDGGAVNNAPISYVLRGLDASGHDRSQRPDVDTVVVITTESPVVAPVTELGGTALAGRVASALIDERIAYDLARALDTNARYEALERALDGVPEPQKQAVLRAAGCWPIQVYLIQPSSPLQGNSFSGFFDRDLRKSYVDAGSQATLRRL